MQGNIKHLNFLKQIIILTSIIYGTNVFNILIFLQNYVKKKIIFVQ